MALMFLGDAVAILGRRFAFTPATPAGFIACGLRGNTARSRPGQWAAAMVDWYHPVPESVAGLGNH
jgi:hypothetical protein